MGIKNDFAGRLNINVFAPRLRPVLVPRDASTGECTLYDSKMLKQGAHSGQFKDAHCRIYILDSSKMLLQGIHS